MMLTYVIQMTRPLQQQRRTCRTLIQDTTVSSNSHLTWNTDKCRQGRRSRDEEEDMQGKQLRPRQRVEWLSGRANITVRITTLFMSKEHRADWNLAAFVFILFIHSYNWCHLRPCARSFPFMCC